VYDRSRQQIALAVDMLLSHQTLVLQETDVVLNALRLFSESKGIGFSDCLMISIARNAGNTPLGTFDSKLGRVEGTVLI
jgi:predicted nucleic-acid-binding protein